jgi:hypothetical protein
VGRGAVAWTATKAGMRMVGKKKKERKKMIEGTKNSIKMVKSRKGKLNGDTRKRVRRKETKKNLQNPIKIWTDSTKDTTEMVALKTRPWAYGETGYLAGLILRMSIRFATE